MTTPPGQRLLMAAAIIVATAAGIVGAIMLIAPGSPPGGLAWRWGLGHSRPWSAAGTSCPYQFSCTPDDDRPSRFADSPPRSSRSHCRRWRRRYLHRDVFDFDRLFAVAWVVLFVASPVTFALLLWSSRKAHPPPGDARVHPAARAVLAALGAVFAGLAVWFWVGVSGPVPFEVAPLGARFLAAWLAFFAVLAAWPALRPARSEARLPLLALIAYGIGGLLAAAGTPGSLVLASGVTSRAS